MFNRIYRNGCSRPPGISRIVAQSGRANDTKSSTKTRNKRLGREIPNSQTNLDVITALSTIAWRDSVRCIRHREYTFRRVRKTYIYLMASVIYLQNALLVVRSVKKRGSYITAYTCRMTSTPTWCRVWIAKIIENTRLIKDCWNHSRRRDHYSSLAMDVLSPSQ